MSDNIEIKNDNMDENISENEDQGKNTVDSMFDKWKNTIMIIIWIIILIVVIGFVGQMLLWQFAPDLWETIFNVDNGRSDSCI